jgi:hypothetical protein
MFSPMSVIHEMMEDGDYSYVDDFREVASKINNDERFTTDDERAKEFNRRTGVNWYHRFKHDGTRHIG